VIEINQCAGTIYDSVECVNQEDCGPAYAYSRINFREAGKYLNCYWGYLYGVSISRV
jgi:hypothetical protein